MKKKITYPKVLLVGRTNVGKSTLFNRITAKKSSIVLEREGVTRDYVEELVTWNEKTFKLVDTGGLSFRRKASEIEGKIQEKVLTLLKSAEILLFVCDGKSGITQDDLHIAKTLHKSKRPVFLLLNKADNKNAFEENKYEFVRLGFENIIHVSAIHAIGIGTLLEQISDNVSSPVQTDEVEDPKTKIIILGKPNVGKSSLMNLLTHQERSIVSPVAGTTREAISENVYFCNELIKVTDTAGVRRKCKVSDELETLMVKSSLQSIKDADIVLLMIDVSAGKISDQELKLLFYALENKKPTIVIYNKVDLLENDEYARAMLEQSMEEYDFILKKTIQVAISCVTKKNICKILGQVQKILERCKQPFDTGEINDLLKQELFRKQLFHKRQLLKVMHIKQIKESRIPTFSLRVNYPEWFGPTQLGFIENTLRKNYDLKGCPVQLVVQQKRKKF